MMQFPGDLRSAASARPSGQRIAYIDEVIAPEEVAALASLFPTLSFEPIGSSWPDHLAQGVDMLILGISAASGHQIEKAVDFLRNRPQRLQVVATNSGSSCLFRSEQRKS